MFYIMGIEKLGSKQQRNTNCCANEPRTRATKRDRQSGMALELSAATNAPPARHGGATADYWLRELLAVIHQDGGRYAAQYGLAQATEDAIAKLNTPPNYDSTPD